MNIISEAAPAKINLRLKVLGKRSDNYHELSMLNVNCSLSDQIDLEIRPGSGVELAKISLDSSLREQLSREQIETLEDLNCNLAARAARLFVERFELEGLIRIGLIKRIPLGAGLGGGSADAAAVLRGLRRYCALNKKGLVAADELEDLARELGADVPYCLKGGLAWVRGIGERVQVIKKNEQPLLYRYLEGRPVVILVPRESMATARVFAAYLGEPGQRKDKDTEFEQFLASMNGLDRDDSLGPRGIFCNDLTSAACALSPALENLRVFGASVRDTLIQMTGSGAAFFALNPGSHRGLDSLAPQLANLLEKLPVFTFDARLIVH